MLASSLLVDDHGLVAAITWIERAVPGEVVHKRHLT
jgi:hypothetical protein